MISGCALLIDYVLTITVSIASGADQVFSVLPPHVAQFKLVVEALVIGFIVLLNLRGVKESVAVLTPIFVLFIVTHAILIFGGFGSHLFIVPQVASEVHHNFQAGLASLGLVGMLGLFMRAYAMGGGTYTGIEAVSNALPTLRDPKPVTGKRTMLYMALSLMLLSGGILIFYSLFHITKEPGKTLNASLFERIIQTWQTPFGTTLIITTLISEAALLFVAAQTGFIGGPQVMANMALDYWMPRRFAHLSEQLTTANGIIFMGLSSIIIMLIAGGNISFLIVLYSINVFITFSLSQFGMCRHWLQVRKQTCPTGTVRRAR